jgi:hypothetical protein
MKKRIFEKAFKTAVTNFDERLIWFTHKGDNTFVNFVWQDKLQKFRIYRDDYYINIWKQHFIDFINTGEFDYNSYWILYQDHNIAPEDIGKVYKFKMENKFNIYSRIYSHFLFEYRKTYPNCGIKQVTKPI